MHGHQTIVSLRRRGMRPTAVWILMDGFLDHDPTWQHWTDMASLAVARTDSVALLDLRFLVGLSVHVAGTDRKRCEDLHERCREAGAKRVLTTVYGPKDTTVVLLRDDRIEFEAAA